MIDRYQAPFTSGADCSAIEFTMDVYVRRPCRRLRIRISWWRRRSCRLRIRISWWRRRSCQGSHSGMRAYAPPPRFRSARLQEAAMPKHPASDLEGKLSCRGPSPPRVNTKNTAPTAAAVYPRQRQTPMRSRHKMDRFPVLLPDSLLTDRAQCSILTELMPAYPSPPAPL